MSRLTVFAAAVLLPLAAMSAALAQQSGPTIDRAWARATPGAAKTGAAYFRVVSPADDRLIRLASPVARKAELHTHIEDNGTMQMREVEGGLPVAPGQALELKPGGQFHVMLIDLNQKLKAGDSFPLTLTFEKAGDREVTVKVEPLGSMGPTDDAGTSQKAGLPGAARQDGGHPPGRQGP